MKVVILKKTTFCCIVTVSCYKILIIFIINKNIWEYFFFYYNICVVKHKYKLFQHVYRLKTCYWKGEFHLATYNTTKSWCLTPNKNKTFENVLIEFPLFYWCNDY
jgi:hypothetical protein